VEKTFPLLREYVVFNAEQCEGVDRFAVQPGDASALVDFAPAQQVIDATGGTSGTFQATWPSTSPPLDYIVLPPKEQFARGPFGPAGYYGTAFHELLHGNSIKYEREIGKSWQMGNHPRGSQ
jgi:antirestriction protein ArdC